jgi:DNA-binding response OmpR family regulator
MHMPVMDGMAATKLIRVNKDGSVKDIPIIAISADAFTQQQQKVLDMGVNDYLTKPIDFNKLLKVLTKYLKLEELQPVKEVIARKEMDSETWDFFNGKVKGILEIPIYMTDQLIEKYTELNNHMSFFNHPYQEELVAVKAAMYSGDEESLTATLKGIVHVKDTDS